MTSPINYTESELCVVYEALASAHYHCENEAIREILESAREKTAAGMRNS